MSPKYLLDTNVISERFKQIPNRGLLNTFQQNEYNFAISAISWQELLFGVERMPPSKRKDTLATFYEEFATTTQILAYDEDAAEIHAAERVRLERAGRHLALFDGQIASIAVLYGLTLVTNNTRDFAFFQDLTVENWMSP